MLITVSAHAQTTTGEQPNPITTSVPFLLIAPDARSGGMGDIGAATTPDAYSMFWNPAKYAFIEKDFGFGIGYVPWLRGLVNDIGLASIVGFKRFGDKQAVAFSLRYFSMGEVTFTNDVGQELGVVKPNEWTIDGTYSRKFSQVISGAVAGRFIYSNLIPTDPNHVAKAGISVAADIAIFGHKEIEVKGLTASFLDFGVNISNIGSKISYNSSSTNTYFIPTNMRIGVGYTMDIDEYNRFSINLDLNKLLVPTPPIYF
ncbi:MAG: type IX secretion system outer membrane channel protein PorV, partial [Bacteroidota bacterium]